MSGRPARWVIAAFDNDTLLRELRLAKRALQCIFDAGVEWYDIGEGDHLSVEAQIERIERVINEAAK